MEKRKPKGPSPDELLDVIDLRDFTQRAVTRTFPKNTVIVREGERTDSLYIIVSGRVKIYVSDEGKEVALGEAGPGEYFGEMVLDERRRFPRNDRQDPRRPRRGRLHRDQGRPHHHRPRAAADVVAARINPRAAC